MYDEQYKSHFADDKETVLSQRCAITSTLSQHLNSAGQAPASPHTSGNQLLALMSDLEKGHKWVGKGSLLAGLECNGNTAARVLAERQRSKAGKHTSSTGVVT